MRTYSEIRDQKSEVRGRRSEVRDRKSEVRDKKSALTSNSNEYLRIIMQIKSAKDLTVYKRAYELAMEIFHASKHFQPRSDIL